MPGKRVQVDPEIWTSLDLLGKDRMMTFQELFEEAVRDLLRKHKRPTSLKEALQKSATSGHAINQGRRKGHRNAA